AWGARRTCPVPPVRSARAGNRPVSGCCRLVPGSRPVSPPPKDHPSPRALCAMRPVRSPAWSAPVLRCATHPAIRQCRRVYSLQAKGTPSSDSGAARARPSFPAPAPLAAALGPPPAPSQRLAPLSDRPKPHHGSSHAIQFLASALFLSYFQIGGLYLNSDSAAQNRGHCRSFLVLTMHPDRLSPPLP